jgi:hypothetical protein
MRSDSLFADLVLRLASHPENVATEGLLYILRNYPDVWTPLSAWIGLTGTAIPEPLSFRSQVHEGSDGSIPDLVGIDSSGEPLLIAEAKFWADLTPNQPATYLGRLPAGKRALVLVIAPALRLEILWEKLLRNCAVAGLQVGNQTDVAHELRAAPVGSTHTLALTSWRAVLSILIGDADARADEDLRSDAEQLSGLCGRMDSTEFLPLTSQDVSRHVGQRVQQFADLVDRAVALLVRDHGASTKGLTTGGAQSSYGRYFLIKTLGCFLVYSPPLWARFGETPLWLRVKSRDFKVPPGLDEKVHAAFARRPNRVCDHDGSSYVGIDLPIGVETNVVLSEIARQVVWAADHCDLQAQEAT